MRTITDPRAGAVDLRVRITDGDGASALLTPVGGGGRYPLERRLAPRSTGRREPSPTRPRPPVDLTDITQVDLVSASDQGQVWVTADLAAAPDALVAVPELRLPTRRRPPGGRRGRRVGAVTARVPFEVHGDVTAPARLAVTTSGQSRGQQQRFNIDLAPGQTSGWVPSPTTRTGSTTTPARSRRSDVAVRNVMTDAWTGDSPWSTIST